MKKKIISLALVLALMLSLLPLAASAGFTAPKQLLTPKQLQGTYASNGITLVDLVTGRKTAATVYLYPDSIAIQSGGKSLTLPLVKVSGSSNELAFSLDGHAVTLELNGSSGRGTLFVNGNGIELFGGVKKVSKCLPAAMNRIIVKNTAKAMTCAAQTAAKVASCLAKNVIKTTGNILRSLLTRYSSAYTEGVTEGMHGIDFLPTSLELEVGETKTVTLKISSGGTSMPVELSFPDCIDTNDFPTYIGVFWDQPVEIPVTGVAAGSGEIIIMPGNPFFNMEVLPVTVS